MDYKSINFIWELLFYLFLYVYIKRCASLL